MRFAIFISLIALLTWFYFQMQPQVETKSSSKPQEYMAELTITSYDLNGKPKERLQAEYWEFIPVYGRSELSKPLVTVYKANGNVWHLSAAKAMAWHPKIGDKITQLDLQQDVVIERTAENGAIPTKVTTQSLQYLPSKAQISSTEYVSMFQPGLKISGYGLRGFLDQNRIELHDDITTVYQHTAS